MGMRVVSFKADEDLLEQLEYIAKRKGKSKSELIRAAIRRYILDDDDRKPFVTKRIRIWG